MCWFGERCIYPGPHYLEAEKQVSRQRRDVDGRNRNYQKLTSSGRKRLAELQFGMEARYHGSVPSVAKTFVCLGASYDHLRHPVPGISLIHRSILVGCLDEHAVSAVGRHLAFS